MNKENCNHKFTTRYVEKTEYGLAFASGLICKYCELILSDDDVEEIVNKTSWEIEPSIPRTDQPETIKHTYKA